MTVVSIKSGLRFVEPGPWQRSRFVPNEQTRHWPNVAIEEAQQREARTIRGPGTVGTPGCNVVFVCDRLDTSLLEYLAHSRGDIDYLLDRVATLERLLEATRRVAMTSVALEQEINEVFNGRE